MVVVVRDVGEWREPLIAGKEKADGSQAWIEDARLKCGESLREAGESGLADDCF